MRLISCAKMFKCSHNDNITNHHTDVYLAKFASFCCVDAVKFHKMTSVQSCMVSCATLSIDLEIVYLCFPLAVLTFLAF